MASLNLPEEFSNSQVDELIEALKKLGKYPNPNNDGGGSSQGTHMNIPKLPNFSGEVPVPKGEVGFEVWKFEVSCLRVDKLHTEVAVTQGARKSLRGEAARIVMNSLGHQATIIEILDKFEGIYGTLETSEELLQRFYNAVQSAGESISTWGCRLEDLLTKATHHKKLSPTIKDEMLRTRFWNGLADPTLKNTTRYKYDTIDTFDELRREIRKMEQEISIQSSLQRKGTRVQHHVQVAEEKDRFDHMSSKLDKLEKKLETLLNKDQSKSEEISAKVLQQLEGISRRLDRLENCTPPVPYCQGPGQGYSYQSNGQNYPTRGRGGYPRRGGRGASTQSSNRDSQMSYSSPAPHLNY